MGKLKDRILEFEEETNTTFEDTQEFRDAYEEWEAEKYRKSQPLLKRIRSRAYKLYADSDGQMARDNICEVIADELTDELIASLTKDPDDFKGDEAEVFKNFKVTISKVLDDYDYESEWENHREENRGEWEDGYKEFWGTK